MRWGAVRANLRELAGSLRHFVRLPAQEDVARARADVVEVQRAARAAEAQVARLEQATSRPASPGPGTP